MTDQAERYDQIAEGYARWWAPVLAPAVDRLLDRLALRVEASGVAGAVGAASAGVAAGTLRLLDVGTGTGQLALAALERWPALSAVGIDASSEMAEMAVGEGERRLGVDGRARFRVEVAFADRLPFDEAAFDLVTASFVLQLVPDLAGALREIRRVLRPGGTFESVTWLAGGGGFEPDRVVDEALDEIGIGPRESEGPSGDFESVERTVRDLRRAGFRAVVADAVDLEHVFTVDGYLGFLTEFDEESTFDEMEPAMRAACIDRLRERLESLSEREMTMRLPMVFVSATR